MRVWNIGKFETLLTFVALTSILAVPSLAAGPYKVEKLGTLRGGSSFGTALNSAGQVVGWSGFRDGGEVAAILWSQGSGPQTLPSIPGSDSSVAFGINQSGVVVGRFNGATSTHAFLWTSHGGIQDLGTIRGDTASAAADINDRGEVVGFSTGSHGMHAFLWSKSTGMRALSNTPVQAGSEARSINNPGAMVGVSKSDSGNVAFLWTSRDGLTSLGTLPGDNTSTA